MQDVDQEQKKDTKKDPKKKEELSISVQRRIASAVIIALFFFSMWIHFNQSSDDRPIKSTTGMRSENSLRSLVLPTPTRRSLHSIVDTSTSFNGEAMQMPYKVIIGETISKEERQKVQEIIEATFWDVHCTFNHFNDLSEISQINKLIALSPRKLSKEFLDLFHLGRDIHYLSEGKFDPSIFNLTSAWKKALEDGRLLSKEELCELKQTIGWHHVEITDAQEICKLNDDLKFDFSSIAKGYSVDTLANRLTQEGFTSYLVEWAGETRVSGLHPENRAWRVGVHDPTSSKNEQIALCEIDEGAIATSGHSEQYWIVPDENETYHSYSHLVNPQSLTPLRISDREIISCTVCAPNCALADGIATAGLLFETVDEALEWSETVQQEYPACDIYFLTRDRVLISKSKNLTKKQHGNHKIYYLQNSAKKMVTR